MIKKPIVYFLTVYIAFIISPPKSWANKEYSLSARRILIERYKNIPDSESIIFPKLNNDEEYNKYLNLIINLDKNNSVLASKFLVDLLEFRLGETTSQLLYYSITKREKNNIIGLLKQKLISKPLSAEISQSRTNKLLWELIDMRLHNVVYICPTDDRPSENEKELYKIYIFQKSLENIKNNNGKYPKIIPEHIKYTIYDQRFDYIGFENGYFLRFSGDDQKFDTEDDPVLPIDTELHEFPTNY